MLTSAAPARPLAAANDAQAHDMRASITVEARCLRRGLFVAALDRPWEGTRFLFQGFLIESESEVQALCEECAWAVVDLARSDPDATRGLEEFIPAAPATKAETKVASRRPVVPANLVPKSEAVRKARTERTQVLVDRTADKIRPLAPERRPAEVPYREALVEYLMDPAPPQTSLPQAKRAAQSARRSLKAFSRDILGKGELQVQKIEEAAADLTECMVENPNALLWLIRAKEQDQSTYLHNITVAVYLPTLGRQLGYPPTRLVEFATIGLLLDVGKLFVDRALLAKAGPLNEKELRDVQRHVELGLEALAPERELSDAVVRGIAEHHERVDGKGYPNQVSGTGISMEGRMAAIADAFSAMTLPRPYAPTMTAYQAMQELYRRAGTHYQESLIDRFVEAVGIFPVGSLIELSSGQIGVVLRHNLQSRLEPCVLVLTDASRNRLAVPFEIDLHAQEHLSLEHKLIRLSRGLTADEFDFDVSKLYLG